MIKISPTLVKIILITPFDSLINLSAHFLLFWFGLLIVTSKELVMKACELQRPKQ